MKRRDAALREISRLDPVRDHQRIVYLTSAFDLPWDSQRSLELALLRTFGVPRSSKLMVETGEFIRRTQKRYDDTVILISTIGLSGYDSAPGRAAIRRMNGIHRRYPIPNDEFLYVLSTFVLEPIRWNARFGVRPLSDNERAAIFLFWREVGRRMAIRGIPESLAALERFSVAYEREHFAYSPDNQALAEATRDLFLSWVLPKPLRPLGQPVVHALFDARMRLAFGFPLPPWWVRAGVVAALRLRAHAARLLPPRRKPYTLPPTRTYPDGYRLEAIGP